MSTTFNLTYTESRALLEAAAQAVAPANSSAQVWKRRIIFGAVALAIYAFFELLGGITVTFRDYIAALIGVFAAAFYMRATLESAERKAQDAAEKDGPTTVTLTAEGFKVASYFGHIYLNWANIDAVRELDGGIAIYWDTTFFPIPYNSLPHRVTPEQFCAQISEWRTAA